VAKYAKYPQCVHDVNMYVRNILAAADFGLIDYKIEGFGETLNKLVCLNIQNFGPTRKG
jgi:hypothetical protein